MPYLRIIGDVHGSENYQRYKELAFKAEHSIQVGDMGFTYDHFYDMDPEHHKFFPGNHDNYSILLGKGAPPNLLPSYGLIEIPNFPLRVWYLRGAWSIDQPGRVAGVSWWPEEELSQKELGAALDDYEDVKPDLVLSHECPIKYAPRILWPGAEIISSRTSRMLNKLMEVHQPAMWIFGHYHRNFSFTEDGTDFQCLNSLNYLDFTQSGSVDSQPFDDRINLPFKIHPDVYKTTT